MAVILMIDDDPMLTGLFAKLFHRVGHVVHSARTGEMGLAAALRVGPDLVMLDQSLPGICGLETLKRLRALTPLAALPAVFYTATVDPQVQTDALALGARGFWWKGTAGFEEICHRVELLVGAAPRGIDPIAGLSGMGGVAPIAVAGG